MNMKNIFLVEAEEKDLNNLVNLIIDFKKELTKYVLSEMKTFRKDHESKKKIKESIRKKIEDKNQRFLLLRNSDYIIGFGCGSIKHRDNLVLKKIKFGELSHLWIDRSYREKEMSSLIKDDLFDWFKINHCQYVVVKVLNDNPAKKIYQHWGFENYITEMRKKC